MFNKYILYIYIYIYISMSIENDISKFFNLSNKNISLADTNTINFNDIKLEKILVDINNTNLDLNKNIINDYTNLDTNRNIINIDNNISNDIDKYLYDKYKRIFLIISSLFKQSSPDIFEIKDFSISKFIEEFISKSKDKIYEEELYNKILTNLQEDIDFNIYINNHSKEYINNIIKFNIKNFFLYNYKKK